MKPSTAPAILERTLKKADPFEPEALPPAVRLPLSLPLHRRRNRMLKRSIDLVVSTLLLLVVFSWMLPLIAVLICLDSRGPVFFRQRRTGRNGRTFFCLKFRTMVPNAEADELPARERDPRITRVGHWLRRTHIDELPQLVQVWLGQMSLIGPRPYMLSDHDRYMSSVHQFHLRHAVKPGLTGLAQARGHYGSLLNLKEMEERVALDLRYIRHWSLVLDLKILWWTFRQIFRPIASD